MALNYSYDSQKGYETDPYRVISVVDPTSGEPSSSLYESRPDRRQTQSIYWDNKFGFGPTVTELSYRYFKDRLGHHLSNRGGIRTHKLSHAEWYVEPNVRYYHQGAADFYNAYLVSGAALPGYASSDTRLAKFDAITYGLKIGFRLSGRAGDLRARGLL